MDKKLNQKRIYQEEWEKLKNIRQKETFRTRVRAFKMVIVLIVVNVLLLSCVGMIFTIYENKNLEQRWMDDILGMHEDGTTDVTRQVTRAITFQEQELKNIADYMETAKLTKEMAYVFIDYMQNMDGMLSLIQLDSREIYSSSKQMDAVYDQVVLEAVEEAYAVREELLYPITKAFYVSQSRQQSVAFFSEISLEGDEYLLVKTLRFGNLFDGLPSMNQNDKASQMIIDTKGNIVKKIDEFFEQEALKKQKQML